MGFGAVGAAGEDPVRVEALVQVRGPGRRAASVGTSSTRRSRGRRLLGRLLGGDEMDKATGERAHQTKTPLGSV